MILETRRVLSITICFCIIYISICTAASPTPRTENFTSPLTDQETTVADITTVYFVALNTTSDNVTTTDNDTNINRTTTSQSPTAKTYRDYPHYKVYKFMIDYFPFIINYSGFVGNFLTLVTALRMKPYNPTSICIITLAATDMATCLMRAGFRHFSPTYYLSQFYCRSINYLYVFLSSFSNFILVCWTFERLVAVAFPMKLQAWCTLRNTKIALLLAVILAALQSFMFIPTITYIKVVVSPTFSYQACVLSELLLEKLIHVSNTLYIWAPMIIIVVCNTAIIGLLAKHRKAQTNMTSKTETSDKRAAEQRRLTIVLISISLTFLLFHIPYAVKVTIESFIDHPMSYGAYYFAQYLVWSQFIIYWLQLQNVVNFIVYCLTGPKFRKEFVNLVLMIFCLRCRKAPVKTVRETITSTTGVTGVTFKSE